MDEYETAQTLLQGDRGGAGALVLPQHQMPNNTHAKTQNGHAPCISAQAMPRRARAAASESFRLDLHP